MATVTREREEQDGFDAQMRLLQRAARHCDKREDDDAAEACRWAASRMQHERSAALAAPPASVNDGWTPEYITGALAKAYPQGGVVIECGDVIEFAHGDDAPQFQRLTHPAAIEDWNGKLRDRVRGIYKRAAAPAPVDARRDCTCTGTCRGASGLGPRWKCALETPAAAPAPAAGEAEQDARARAMREGA